MAFFQSNIDLISFEFLADNQKKLLDYIAFNAFIHDTCGIHNFFSSQQEAQKLYVCFLIKNAVIKNIIYNQNLNQFNINRSVRLNIDSKKEFNVSVNASLFLTNLNSEPSSICKNSNFYEQSNQKQSFGWYKNKFVSSIEDYESTRCIDGNSNFEWRSGVKHDCSKVMELEKINNQFKNHIGEKFHLEDHLVYGLLKSSDLKGDKANSYRKYTIITQNKIVQETGYIKEKYPMTYQYLNAHIAFLRKRKSSIYKGKPAFSIFGIGKYSFKKYKVGISGLYKSTHFTLIYPDNNKPIMLDDTCYFIGFDDLKTAEIVHFIVNSSLVQKFLQSIIFSDAKRPINKDILMRIDFRKAFDILGYDSAKSEIGHLDIEEWENFGDLLEEHFVEQTSLF